MTPAEELEHAANRVPDFERRARLHNKAAVAKARKQAGPLFADFAEAEIRPLTVADEYWRWRQDAAKWAGWMGPTCKIGEALGWIRLAAIEAHGRRLIGDDAVFARIKDNIRRTLPMPEYGPE